MRPDLSRKQDKQNPDGVMSSFVSPKIRIKYFTCTKGKDHEGQVLNYVCVKKDCQKRGLLCSMCKVDHTNHATIPLKMLLSKLQTHKQKPLQSSQGFQNQLELLEQTHKTMLYNLRVCVQTLAQKFKEIQIQINDQFSKAKIQLLERVQINMKFNTFIEQAIANKFENRQQFIQDMSRISGMIEIVQDVNQKDKQLDIKFSANFDQVVTSLKNVQIQLNDTLNKIQNFVNQNGKVIKYQDIKNAGVKKDKKGKQKEKEKEKQKQKDIKLQQLNKIPKIFSPDYKSTSINLEQQNKIAKQTKTGEGRFVFSNCQIQALNQKVIFKIKTLKNWIGLGIGIRQKLKFLNFRFEYSNLGHGSYLISSNGYSWSHTEQSNNIAVVTFKFKEGDLIQLEYEKTKLIFSNKNSNDKYELKLAFNEAEQKDIYFCANLCSQGDSVEIMEA